MKYTTGCRISLLSPAYAGVERARMILSDHAQFELARKLRHRNGAPIAEVFTFLSGLYFRGKIAYASAFARPARGTPSVLAITPTRGLIDARTRIGLDDRREFAAVDIYERDPRCPSSATRDAWQRGYRSKARSFSLAALPRANTRMFCWRLLARDCGSPRSSSVAAI